MPSRPMMYALTLDYFTCRNCGKRGRVAEGCGPANMHAEHSTRARALELPSAAQECPRCKGYLEWHAMPFAPSYFNAKQLEVEYRPAQLSSCSTLLAWLATGRQKLFGNTPLWAFAVEHCNTSARNV